MFTIFILFYKVTLEAAYNAPIYFGNWPEMNLHSIILWIGCWYPNCSLTEKRLAIIKDKIQYIDDKLKYIRPSRRSTRTLCGPFDHWHIATNIRNGRRDGSSSKMFVLIPSMKSTRRLNKLAAGSSHLHLFWQICALISIWNEISIIIIHLNRLTLS